MKADFNARWAEAPATLRREPTALELTGGFPCGPLDLPLWNELMYRLTQTYGELSSVIRLSGQTASSSNLTQVWEAILKAARDAAPTLPPDQAFWHTGTAGGTASALNVASVTPPISSERDFLPCLIRVPQGVAANATLTISGISGALQRNDGAPVQDGDAPIGGDVLVARHGDAWRLVGFGRVEVQRLVPNPVIWVRIDGNDANDGSENSPSRAKRTLGAALSQGTSAFNFSTTALTIRLGTPGTYASSQYIPVAAGLIRIIGDEASQDSYVIFGNGSVAQGMLQGAGPIEFRGVKLQNNGTNSHVLVGTAGANILCLNTTLAVSQGTTGNHVLAAGGQVTLGAGCVITGSSANMAVGASGGEVIFNTGANIQIQGNPTFSVSTVRADNLGRITLLGGAQVTGSANGQRYLVGNYSIILTTGAGEFAFPGSQSGFVSPTGIYQ
jgi:hypothetical protein